MAGADDETMAQRARAIWAYSGLEQDELAKLAKLSAGRVKAMMGRKRAAEPSLPEVVKLAQAAGVPRMFAERGFEGLWDPGETLLHDVEVLKVQMAELVVRDAEALSRIEALEQTIRDSPPPRRP